MVFHTRRPVMWYSFFFLASIPLKILKTSRGGEGELRQIDNTFSFDENSRLPSINVDGLTENKHLTNDKKKLTNFTPSRRW